MGEHSSKLEPNPGAVRAATPFSAGRRVSPGDLLYTARHQRGLTLEEISATTKIPTRHLEALERDDFGVTPGGMYLRAEIRAYADAVGLDRKVALECLQAAIDPPPVADVAPAPEPTRPPAPRRAPRRLAVAVAVCVCLAAIVTWAASHNSRSAAPRRVVSQTTTAPVEPVTAPAAPDSVVALADRSSARSSAPEAVAATSGVVSAPATAAPAHATPDRATPAVSAAGSHTVEPELDITSEPAGARVTVDGVGWGVTPVTIHYLPAGHKRLRLTRDGFATQERVVDVAPRARTTVRLTLRPLE